jgi:hypothetical protein
MPRRFLRLMRRINPRAERQPPSCVPDRLQRNFVILLMGIRINTGVDIDKEIMARINGAKAWDRDSKPEDFQIRAAENGYVLINLKTRRAQLIYDDDSELGDLRELFPNLIPFPDGKKQGGHRR